MNSNVTIPDHIRKILSKAEPLDIETEVDLLSKASAGDSEARDRIVMSNYRYIAYYVMRFINLPASLSFEDIMNTGIIGLLKALNTYDCSKKCRFITYAHWWIRKEIVTEIYRNLTIITIPANRLRALEAIEKIRQQKQNDEAETNGSCVYSNDQIAEQIIRDAGGSLMELEGILAAMNAMQVGGDCIIDDSLDVGLAELPAGDFDRGSSYPGYVAQTSSCERDQERVAATIDAAKALQYLDKREDDIVRRYYGIGCPPQTLKDISSYHLVSAERARQITCSALQKIKEAWEGGQ